MLSAAQLVEGIDASWALVERVLDTWTLASLAEVIRHPEWGADDRAHPRGFDIERVFAHDVTHIAELNDVFAANGLPLIDLWG